MELSHSELRKSIRKEKIKYRDSLSDCERIEKSEKIVDKLIKAGEFDHLRKSANVLIYKGIRGEVRLERLEELLKNSDVRLLYPLCISDKDMIALLPSGEDAWKEGFHHIQEPIKEKSEEVNPADIDLVICPCTAFDDKCNRMGMGAGFYDRFLQKCVNARIIAVAFYGQGVEELPIDEWDKPMEAVYTEEGIILGE